MTSAGTDPIWADYLVFADRLTSTSVKVVAYRVHFPLDACRATSRRGACDDRPPEAPPGPAVGSDKGRGEFHLFMVLPAKGSPGQTTRRLSQALIVCSMEKHLRRLHRWKKVALH